MTHPSREHVPNRPCWDCFACNKPWPCAPAREELAERLDVVALGEFMGARMVEAGRDMPTTPPAEMFERFLEWTRVLRDR